MPLRHLGPIMQTAYVVEDLHVAISNWSQRLSVGPFFVIPHVQYKSLTYRGEPTNADVSLAFAFSGDLQIELVQQHNDTPSVFRDFRARQGAGAHHFAILSQNVGLDTGYLASLGVNPIQHGIAESGTETVFFEFEQYPGGILELIQVSEAILASFQTMKVAAQQWDGASPYAPRM